MAIAVIWRLLDDGVACRLKSLQEIATIAWAANWGFLHVNEFGRFHEYRSHKK